MEHKNSGVGGLFSLLNIEFADSILVLAVSL